jgi:hypothetical protein
VNGLNGTLIVTGNAEITDDGTLRLTSNSSPFAQSGNVTTREKLDVSYTDAPTNTKARPFHSYFVFAIGPNTGTTGGAGLAFWGHNGNAGDIGSSGDGLGYGGLGTSFAVEFDTLTDPAQGGKVGDPKDNHIGFMVDGKAHEHPATFIPTESGVPIPFATANKNKFYVWIDYEGGDSRQLDVYFSKTKDKPTAPIAWELHKEAYSMNPEFPFPDSFNMVDLFTKTGLPAKAFIGFTAATYNETIRNDHIVYEWEFSTEGVPCACQGATACKGTATTHACSAGPGTKDQGVCVECTMMDQGACTSKHQVCKPETETCVACNVGADCPNDKPVCDPKSNACGPCTTDADCEGHPGTSLCVPSGPLMGQCILPCSKDKPCPAGYECNEAAGKCEQCAEGQGCSGDIIEGGGCACAVLGGWPQDGLATSLLSALGLASFVARRRRRRA